MQLSVVFFCLQNDHCSKRVVCSRSIELANLPSPSLLLFPYVSHANGSFLGTTLCAFRAWIVRSFKNSQTHTETTTRANMADYGTPSHHARPDRFPSGARCRVCSTIYGPDERPDVGFCPVHEHARDSEESRLGQAAVRLQDMFAWGCKRYRKEMGWPPAEIYYRGVRLRSKSEHQWWKWVVQFHTMCEYSHETLRWWLVAWRDGKFFSGMWFPSAKLDQKSTDNFTRVQCTNRIDLQDSLRRDCAKWAENLALCVALPPPLRAVVRLRPHRRPIRP